MLDNSWGGGIKEVEERRIEPLKEGAARRLWGKKTNQTRTTICIVCCPVCPCKALAISKRLHHNIRLRTYSSAWLKHEDI